jgi:arabinofuranan 3-O-arabinosyltransferase
VTKARWLALLVYPLTLLSSPGRIAADTKLFLYLDPGEVLDRASSTWDTSQYAGFVPHQQISYLWPAGPWYWLMDVLSVPDWVAQRLWIASLLLLAGWGVMWLSEHLGFRSSAAFAAGAVYMLSPYVLAYVSRTSVMLLPWAGLGWIVGCTVLAARRGGWRFPASCALVVLTVGATNATALAMVAPVPVIWLVTAASQREISRRQAVKAALRIGALSLAVSLWWIVFLLTQGRFGINILSYTETLEAVSSTSIGPETVRGLGYWLNYIRDHVQATTDAAAPYHTDLPLMAAGYLLVLAGLGGIAGVRWTARRFAALLVLAGIVLSVGGYPLSNPAPIFGALADNTRSTLALALRSSTRALPMSALGLALGAGALVAVVRRVERRRMVAGGIVLLAVANLPALWTGSLVDRYVSWSGHVPAAWQEAADVVSRSPETGRVMQLPGAEFGAFRWGYTVDPPLPGLTDRPFVSRDLQPLGSPAAMDLLYALDDRFQNGTAEAASVAPVARLLAADTVWVAGDMAFERFRTPRPELTEAFYRAGAPGLGAPTAFGEPAANTPDVPMVDERSVGDDRIGTAVSPVLLVPVESPSGIVRVKTGEVLVAGSGDGVIDAAAAGLLTGDEVLFYAAAAGDALVERVRRAVLIVVTDSNRDRARHWRGSQATTGFTEDGTDEPGVTRFDSQDQRLPVFPDDRSASRTIAVQRGPVRAVASSYGSRLEYWPEYRAAMALDGDPATAWRVAGDGADPRGESIVITAERPMTRLRLRQPLGDRRITSVEVRGDGWSQDVTFADDAIDVVLDRAATSLTLVIGGVTVGRDPVGFAEIDTGLGATEEVVVVPTDALSLVGDAPLALVFTRERIDATDRRRDDPETVLTREFTLSQAASFEPTITARLDPDADDRILAGLLGVPTATASGSLEGVLAARAWAAIDGDPATAWRSPFGPFDGQWLEVTPEADALQLVITQPSTGDHARITRLKVERAGRSLEVDVAWPTATVEVPPGADPVRLTVLATDGATTIDRMSGASVQLPVGIAEIEGDGFPEQVATSVDTGCLDGLLSVDDTPLVLRLTGSVASLVAGEPFAVETCGAADLRLEPGRHVLRSHRGAIDIDRVVLRNSVPSPSIDAPLAVASSGDGGDRRTLTVPVCPEGCWLVFGEGFNTGWSADGDVHGDLGTSMLVDGGFNGWWLPPSDGPQQVTLRWAAQRPVDVALWASGVAVVGCLMVVAWPLRCRRGVRLSAGPHGMAVARIERDDVAPEPPWSSAPVGAGRAAISTVGTVLAAYAVVGTLGAAVAFVVTAVTCLWWRRPAWTGVAAVAGMAVSAAFVLVQTVRLRPPPGASFLAAVSDAHQPMVLAVVLLVAAVCATPRVRSRTDDWAAG